MLLAEDRIDTAFFSYEPGSPDTMIHNDHLATPQKMTDASGAVVWAADYKPFGEATITVSTITNNLRFPGQYYDAESFASPKFPEDTRRQAHRRAWSMRFARFRNVLNDYPYEPYRWYAFRKAGCIKK
jgi:RHS protein